MKGCVEEGLSKNNKGKIVEISQYVGKFISGSFS